MKIFVKDFRSKCEQICGSLGSKKNIADRTYVLLDNSLIYYVSVWVFN